MLDNGYLYLAASRLSLHRSEEDWALVFEIFGYSPRAGLPDLHVQTFASRLHNRDKAENYVTPEAFHAYLDNNPNNESRFFYPIAEGPWIDAGDAELVSTEGDVTLRDVSAGLPAGHQYAGVGIDLSGDRPAVFEFCRFLGFQHRELVMAAPAERRVSVPPELKEILVLDDWHHPDVCAGELPSGTETFRQLAEVLATGHLSRYQSAEPHNTHWKHWPDGGTL